MLQFEHITINPKVLGGKPIIKDTRISVEFILELLASGAAVKEAILFVVFRLKSNVFIDIPLNAS